MNRSWHLHGGGLTLCVLLTLSLTLGGCAGGVDRAGGTPKPPVVTLTVINTRSAAELAPFAATLATVSGGSLSLAGGEKYERTSATAEADAIRAVQSGTADLAVIPARAWHAAGVNSFDALVAPMAVDSMALERKVLAGTVPIRMLPGVDKLGLVGLGILPGPMRRLAGTSRVLVAPADLSGATIAISPSAVAERAIRTLGAVPVNSPFEGADLNGDDGIEQQVVSVAGNQYDGVVRSVIADVNLWPRPFVVVGNARAMSRLTATQLGQLRTAASGALDTGIKNVLDDEKAATAILCRRGRLTFRTAGPAGITSWREAFAPVQAWLRQDPQTGEFLDEIARLRAVTGNPPSEQPSCDRSQPPADASARPATPFDGVYEMDTSEMDGRTIDPNIPPENWGHWVYVFGGGRFAITQENARACTWGYGTYAVTGAQVEWRFSGGGGIAPTRALNKAGEDFVFAWTRYRDTMALSAVPGAISPDNFFLRPWHRISGSPSGSFLSRRCPPPAAVATW